MLRHLSIRDVALIEHVECSIGTGMTVLLGETGAGKSIIIDALAAALGERMSADQLRSGARRAVIEATFTSDAPQLHALLAELDLAWDNADIVFRRELTASGTSRCFVNDTPTQAAVVRSLAAFLLDFHGQHDTHGLLHPSRHLTIIDAVGGLQEQATAMAAAWRNVVEARSALAALRARANSAEADRQRLQHQADEITNVNPQPNEDEEITVELRRAESSEFVVANATAFRDELYNASMSAYDRLSNAIRHADALAPFAPELARLRDDLANAMAICRDAAQEASGLADPEDFSPERIEELRQRLVQLQRLVRRYGSLDEARSEHARLLAALDEIDHVDEALDEAQATLEAHMSAATAVAADLSKRRRKVIATLASSISNALHEMGMPSAVVEIAHSKVDLGPNGIDAIEVLFTANAGESPRPLSKVASGGELSRVMLAIKRTMAVRGAIGTMVFDEIDTGISGKVARHVGEVMKELSTHHQILCITHLPQIASLADHVVRVEKQTTPTSTTVTATTVEGEDAILEIARLLSGVTVSEAAMDSARELMTSSQKR
ncbi:MAG: DNA repair protein RecN [Candidatus Kapabacteria bacterium]|nr:DNA repair protein RecN [Candidatus Kapabacteria bacterium]